MYSESLSAVTEDAEAADLTVEATLEAPEETVLK